MSNPHDLKILVTEATSSPDLDQSEPKTGHSALWGVIDKVRQSQDPTVEVKLRPHVPNGATSKSGEAEAILVLVGMATFAAKPVLRFIVDLAKILLVDRVREVGARRRNELTVKTSSGEITIKSEKEIEELQSIAEHVVSQRIDGAAGPPAVRNSEQPDIEIFISQSQGPPR